MCGMALVLGSAALEDGQFLSGLETGSLPIACFRHADHLRLAWLRVRSQPLDEAIKLVKRDIFAYAETYGVEHIFHHTVTEAWVRLLATHGEASFGEFLVENEQRLSTPLLHRFWTPETLGSEAARQGWVPPDRAPLPN